MACARNKLASKFIVVILVFVCHFQAARADRVHILNAALDAAQARIDIIQQAEKTLYVQYYEFDNDNFSRVILSLLRQAALGTPERPSVDVKLIVDGAHNRISPAMAKALLDAHVQIKVYHPFNIFHLARSLKRMHDKDIIADETKLITGGRNIGKDYFEESGNLFIDRDIYAQGEEAAKAAADYFIALWNSKEVKPLNLPPMPKKVRSPEDCRSIDDAAESMQCLHDGELATSYQEAPAILEQALLSAIPNLPVKFNTQNVWIDGSRDIEVEYIHDVPGKIFGTRGTYDKITELLKTADDSVVIESPYLVPSRELMAVFRSLTDPNRPSKDPARPPHAVKVRILTNSLVAGSVGILAQTGYEAIKKELLAMHIDIWETKKTFIHAKSFAIDDRISIIGSFNTDIRSEKLNSEVAIVIYDHEVNQELRDSMDKHLTEAYELDPIGFPLTDDHRYPGASHKLIGELRLLKLLLPIFYNEL